MRCVSGSRRVAGDWQRERKTPHRFRPKTPESASPLGEGEEAPPLRGQCGVRQRSPQRRRSKSEGRFRFGLRGERATASRGGRVDGGGGCGWLGVRARGGSHPHPALSLNGEGKNGSRSRESATAPVSLGVGRAEDPHPDPLPRVEGEKGGPGWWVAGKLAWVVGVAATRIPGSRPGQAPAFSLQGEGERAAPKGWRGGTRRWLGAVGARKTPHPRIESGAGCDLLPEESFAEPEVGCAEDSSPQPSPPGEAFA